jgi:hypothetical protein
MKALIITGITGLLLAIAGTAQASKSDRYNFRVYLDDEPIGTHKVQLTQQKQQQTVDIKANFTVKALFLNIFRYNHSNSETWNGRCLQAIDARTRVNGENQFVKSKAGGKPLKLETHEGEKTVEGCIRTFAYWDKELLKSSRQLLNTQTGEVVPTSLQPRGVEEIEVADKRIKAKRYTLSAGKDTIDLWYSMNNRWIALESVTRIGKKLRYEAI